MQYTQKDSLFYPRSEPLQNNMFCNIMYIDIIW